MKNNTSISLGPHFQQFIEASVSSGRYKNASEVIRAALRLFEQNEKHEALKTAIQEGLDSGIDYDPVKHLEELNARHERRHA